ncbi:DedA family protein [Sciscionella marina]|uniref:DedA family protein n=1 Tax=Sciscionella marina TaxID=508770 RepID=UPI000372EF25|nr:DedA family protein [Sciscionella marina]
MFELLDTLTTVLRENLDQPWLWLLVFGIAALDAVIPLSPSETTVVTVAVLIGPDPARLLLLFAVAAGGALAGDCASHLIGRRAGPGLLRRMQRTERNRRRYEWVRTRTNKYTPLLVIAGRYLPGCRFATGMATGSMRYPFGRFLAFDALGACGWAAYSVLIGYIGGSQFTDDPLKGLLLAYGLALLLCGCVEVGRRIAARRRQANTEVRVGEPV